MTVQGQVIAIALLLTSAGGLVSCAGGSSADQSRLQPVDNALESLAHNDRTAPERPRSGDLATLDPEGMAAQLRRDMEAMRHLNNGSSRGHTPAEAELDQGLDPRDVRRSPGASRQIDWNQHQPPPSASTRHGEVTSPLAESSTSSTTDATNQASPVNILATPEPALSGLPGESPQSRLRELMVSLSSHLYQDAAYADSPLPQYLVIASMSMVSPDRALNPDALPDLNDREREILRAYQAFFIDIGRQMRATGDTELLVDAIEQLRKSVRAEPTLRLPRAALCWRVRGYGQYDEFDKNAFLAGSGQQVIVYTEIEEFTSDQNQKGEWVTDLTEELIILSKRDGIPAWRQAPLSVPDVSRNKRREFFISHIITLPAALSVGAYTLKVRVTDEKSGAVAESSIDFMIVADSSLAAKIPQ